MLYVTNLPQGLVLSSLGPEEAIAMWFLLFQGAVVRGS